MISLDETLLSLPDAAKRVPGGVHISTIHRWRTRGVQGLKLETLKLGGRRVTSLEALQRFADAVSEAADGTVSSRPTTTRRRSHQIDAAVKEVAAKLGARLPSDA